MDSTLARAISVYGINSQIDMAIEELAELIQELTKIKRGKYSSDTLAEEIADVQIMLDQLKFHYQLAKPVETYRKMKILRLQDRLNETNQNKE